MSANRGPRAVVSRPASAALGRWLPDGAEPAANREALRAALADLNRPVLLVETASGPAVATGGSVTLTSEQRGIAVLAILPPLNPTSLGDPSFTSDHGLRFPYVTGAMANGIASAEVVEAIAGAGMLAFFGAAGLSPDRIETALVRLKANLAGRTYGFNLIHSPNEQSLESATVDLFLRHGLRLVEASAYLDLTPHIVRYRLTGIHRGPNDEVVTPNRVIANVSRV